RSAFGCLPARDAVQRRPVRARPHFLSTKLDRPNARTDCHHPVTEPGAPRHRTIQRSEEHTSELQSLTNLVCRLLLATNHSPSSLLSLQPPGAHRDLLSFPTRRSSDLSKRVRLSTCPRRSSATTCSCSPTLSFNQAGSSERADRLPSSRH